MKRTLTVRTPAKLILSGEHAVVHGCPAIAVAINRYMEVRMHGSSPSHFSFDLMGMHVQKHVTRSALRQLKDTVKKKYHQYSLGELRIKDVLQHPFELALFTVINVLDQLKKNLPKGIKIFTDSNIPIGCGLGSSAASIVSLIYALTEWLQRGLSLEAYIQLGKESENLQHGLSSGLDLYTVYYGGYIHYHQHTFKRYPIDHLSLHQTPMQLVETGQPASSTGECVSHSTRYFKQHPIVDQFSAITQALHDAIRQGDTATIKTCMRRNHLLLCQIGVVPDQVKQFIEAVEHVGGAAKVCGAGSIRGHAAGAVWVMADQDVSPLATQYGYQASPLLFENRGTHLVL